MTATEGMAHDYDEHSEYQRAVADTATALIVDSVGAVHVGSGDAFVVADYGASTGKNSMASMRAAVDALRNRHAGQPVVALHNDLPTNDWNQLVANLTSANDSYLTLPGPAVVPLVSPVSFFEPAAPPRSVHLGMSFSAAHWLREPPRVRVPEGFYFCDATGDARAALASRADADWTAFLVARAADLAAGGRLVVQDIGTAAPDDGGPPLVTAARTLRAMAEVAAGMVADGLLTADAVERYVLPAYARTVAEARAPLTRRGSPAAGMFTEVVCRTDPVPNPYLTKWMSDHDDAAYARAYAAFVRGFTESSLRDQLFVPGAPAGEAEDALGEFFRRLTARFAADPERDPFEDWTLTVVLTRN
jgi:cyclopropane-fatty-acyl-phospholipid synthase